MARKPDFKKMFERFKATPGRASETSVAEASGAKGKLFAAFIGFSSWFQFKAQPVLRKFDWSLIRACALILGVAFVLASSVSTFAANFALNFAISARKTQKPAAEGQISVPMVASDGGPSGGELKKFILERNVFNSEGALAPEAEAAGGVKKTQDLDFDAVPCSEEKLPIEVVGTIFTGNPLTSYVSVRDPKISENDTYKHGDVIIEHEDFEVHKVFRGNVEFRKGDQKICIALKGFGDEKKSESGVAGASAPGSVRPENVENLDFDSSMVQSEIGPGYANILNSAKLIPEIEPSGKTAGFKIIAITSGSLFEKMKFQNGDVITEVNGVSLRDASQGFKLYQALQEEREITVNLTRNGEPMVRKVRVK
ncbi:MAG: PDZ domain-containing protein [Silvanigrellales bacterium]|nr:PDZ domain-containing protein [Silvanigrellales bacterium]